MQGALYWSKAKQTHSSTIQNEKLFIFCCCFLLIHIWLYKISLFQFGSINKQEFVLEKLDLGGISN